jgi:hypothetical protein
VALGLLLFGRGLIGQFTSSHIGAGSDPLLMTWWLSWWPHAIERGINPLVTDAWWAPFGHNLTWSPSIPIVSLAAAPITAALGPIATLNVLCLASLPLAAWAAFLLCRYVSGSYSAAIVGGWIFGFSPFMLGKLFFAQLQFLFLFPLPLIVLCILRRLHGEAKSRHFIVALSILLVATFLISTEIFATMTVFAAFALPLAWCFVDRRTRRALARTVPEIAGAYCIAGLAVAPYLYFFFFGYHPYDGAVWGDDLNKASTDIANLLIPTPANEIGRLFPFDRISTLFNGGNPAEAVAYVAWPLLIVLASCARRHWAAPWCRISLCLLGAILILSLGASITVAGVTLPGWLPWRLLRVSVLENVSTVRFAIYASLLVAVMVSIWLAGLSSGPIRFCFAAAIAVFLLPNMTASFWVRPVEQPTFFRDGRYRSYLTPGETVFIMPTWPSNEAMLWQAQAHFWFKMAQGPGPWPTKVSLWPFLETTIVRTFLPSPGQQFAAYLAAHRVSTVIVADSTAASWAPLIAELGPPAATVGGVTLYRVKLEKGMPGSQARQLADAGRFETLFCTLDRFLADERDPRLITAGRAGALGLIPASALIGPPSVSDELRSTRPGDASHARFGVWLYGTARGTIIVGSPVWHVSARDLLERYGHLADRQMVFPSTWEDQSRSRPNLFVSLLMEFKPAKIHLAAAASGCSPKR